MMHGTGFFFLLISRLISLFLEEMLAVAWIFCPPAYVSLEQRALHGSERISRSELYLRYEMEKQKLNVKNSHISLSFFRDRDHNWS
jgi:hypothetical protein